ncbi:ATP-dependent 6-phosphofructokinase [Aegicerativicinus sediminis]
MEITYNFDIESLGESTFDSPLGLSNIKGDNIHNFVDENYRILYNIKLSAYKERLKKGLEPISMLKAGPREKVFFKPEDTTAAIVTCGGLCPGLNNVIRDIVMTLYYHYGVKSIYGIPYGYEGLSKDSPHKFVELTPDEVKDIHEFGGTILGSSRGGHEPSVMVDKLVEHNVDILFTIGGDGTLKGANAIGEEIERRGLKISVVGIPKTIDNDIDIIDQSFGFESAFGMATPILRDAHNEATGAFNGIAIVKLMGRDSGFIAASAALSNPVVNFVLVPEMDFRLKGKNGLVNLMRERLKSQHHAVIVVAEGAGQHLFENKSTVKDASGNIKHQDIGSFLQKKLKKELSDLKPTIKYIDPSYIIRSAAANSTDSVFCTKLAYHAVHGAMSGKTKMVVGKVNGYYVYLPISEVTKKRKKIDLEGDFWFSVVQSTGQPFTIG